MSDTRDEKETPQIIAARISADLTKLALAVPELARVKVDVDDALRRYIGPTDPIDPGIAAQSKR